VAAGSAVVAVSYEEAGTPASGRGRDGASAESLSFAETVLERVGGRVWREGDATVLLEIQVAKPKSDDMAAEAENEVVPVLSEAAVAPPSPRPSLHAGDDLAGARQGDHL
jgi:hypothetical protein